MSWKLHVPIVAAAVAVAFAAPSAHAANVASDFALPIWQGTRTSAPALGHQIDCTSTNFYAPDGCTFSLHTVTTGVNCTAEVISNAAGGATGENLFRNTPCVADVTGYVVLAQTDGGCVFTGGDMWLQWQSGVNSTWFSSAGRASVFVKPTSSLSEWIVTLKTVRPAAEDQHVLEMDDRFVARFNRPLDVCPGDDVKNLKANLYDLAANVGLDGKAGYVKDSVVV